MQKSIVSNATLTLTQHFAATNALLKQLLDPLMEQYKTSNPDFYNEYKSVQVIHDIGHRHTVLFLGFIYDNHNHALAGALVKLTGSDRPHKKITRARASINLHDCI